MEEPTRLYGEPTPETEVAVRYFPGDEFVSIYTTPALLRRIADTIERGDEQTLEIRELVADKTLTFRFADVRSR